MLPDEELPGSTAPGETQDPATTTAREDRVLVERFLTARETGAGVELEAAFRMLVTRYQERIHRLVYRYTKDALEAEDVTQDVFLKLYRKLDSFQWDSAFYTWLYRIAVNTAADHVSKRQRRPVQLSEDVGQLMGSPDPDPSRQYRGPSASESPDESLLQEERAEVTHRILEQLPEGYRTILVLREFEELSYVEISEVLGCSLGTVESRLFRARARFRRILEERYPELLR